MRHGVWLPIHEQFLFESVEAMLKKYPSQLDFKRDFQEYFSNLKPEEAYPRSERNRARSYHETDYCLDPRWFTQKGCNEITLPKPLKIKNPRIFSSKEELATLLTRPILKD